MANPFSLVKDTGRACMEAFTDAVPKQRDYLDVLGVLYSLMRELRAKSRNEVEVHIDNPKESPIFLAYPSVLKRKTSPISSATIAVSSLSAMCAPMK